MYTLTISVTQENIDNGVCKDPYNCGIADALKCIFPKVNAGCYYIAPNHEKYTSWVTTSYSVDEAVELGLLIKCPSIVTQFITNFDNGKNVKPMSFDIEIHDSIIDDINIDEVRKVLTNHPNLVLHEG